MPRFLAIFEYSSKNWRSRKVKLLPCSCLPHRWSYIWHNLKVTREQFAQMLYNYAKYKKCDLTKAGDLTKFPDEGSVSDWAVTALSWANGNGLINGHENGTLDPQGNTVRGQAASILMNFDLNVVKSVA